MNLPNLNPRAAAEPCWACACGRHCDRCPCCPGRGPAYSLVAHPLAAGADHHHDLELCRRDYGDRDVLLAQLLRLRTVEPDHELMVVPTAWYLALTGARNV